VCGRLLLQIQSLIGIWIAVEPFLKDNPEQGCWSRSKSEGANFDYEIWEVEVKAQADVNGIHGGLGFVPPQKNSHFRNIEGILDTDMLLQWLLTVI